MPMLMMKNTLPHSLDLPLHNGVRASCVQVPMGAWGTALHFLCTHFSAIDEVTWYSRFARGLVLDASGKALSPETTCKVGDRIYYYREVAQEVVIPLQEKILYCDERFLVVDKPHFLPVIPSGKYVQQTLLARLQQTTGIAHLSPIHRIDKDTAGLVLFSTNPKARDAYQALFRQHAVEKTYHAIAPINPSLYFPLQYSSRVVEDEQFFRSKEIAGKTNSETHLSIIDQSDRLALYALKPITGKKHQLRVQMAALKIPIVNDVLYPLVTQREDDDFSRPLQLLAKSIAFIDPMTQQPRYFESEQSLSLNKI